MLRQFMILLPVFVAGLVFGRWAMGSDPAPVTDTSSTPALARDFDHAGDYQRLEQMVDSLTEILNFEVSERRRLEEQVSGLIEQVAKLDTESTDDALDATELKRLADVRNVTRQKLGRAITAGQMTEERFIEAGFPPDVANRLKSEMDDIEMQRLYLRDQAIREGWLGSSRYRDELRQLNARQNSFREELSPVDYDRYLYALGRPNRINVNSVLSASPADRAGLLAGDQIISYDGQRVFSPAEIRRETSRGDIGTLIAVEIVRDGQQQVVYLPRGPLGVQMGSAVIKP